MNLPADIARCNGQGCHLRTDCQRYLDNSYQGDRTITMPAAVTCGKGGQVCLNQITTKHEKAKK